MGVNTFITLALIAGSRGATVSNEWLWADRLGCGLVQRDALERRSTFIRYKQLLKGKTLWQFQNIVWKEPKIDYEAYIWVVRFSVIDGQIPHEDFVKSMTIPGKELASRPDYLLVRAYHGAYVRRLAAKGFISQKHLVYAPDERAWTNAFDFPIGKGYGPYLDSLALTLVGKSEVPSEMRMIAASAAGIPLNVAGYVALGVILTMSAQELHVKTPTGKPRKVDIKPDMNGSRAAFEKAILRDPKSAGVYHWYLYAGSYEPSQKRKLQKLYLKYEFDSERLEKARKRGLLKP